MMNLNHTIIPVIDLSTNELTSIRVSEIERCTKHKSGKYTVFHAGDKTYRFALDSLELIEETLLHQGFVMTDQANVVNLSAVESFDEQNNTLVLKGSRSRASVAWICRSETKRLFENFKKMFIPRDQASLPRNVRKQVVLRDTSLMNEPIEMLYREIGVQCPFVLAKQLNLNVSYSIDLSDIYGLYTRTTPNTLRIFINACIPLEVQEDICEALIKHHLEHPGVSRCFNAADYEDMMQEINHKLKQVLPKRKLNTVMKNFSV